LQFPATNHQEIEMLAQLNRSPRVGDRVRMPADRGDKAAWGKLTHVSTERCTHPSAPGAFVWCTVKHDGEERAGVWPSHRLGYRLPQA
jgi:hypothetical protein